MIKHPFTSFTFLLAFSCIIGCSAPDHPIVGVKCYHLPASEMETMDTWKALGINTAYVSEEIARNPEFRSLARAAGMEVYLIFPVFYNPEALQADSSLWAITATGAKAKDGWVEFVCPSHTAYRENVIAHAKQLVSDLQPDGLSIDFIRHFIYWEMVKPSQKVSELSDACYCRHCLTQFAEEKQIRYPDSLKSTKQFSAYINEHHQSEWVNFKCELITSMVDELTSEVRKVDPGMKFNLHAVPWRKGDYHGAALKIAGQDLSELAPLVDYISPMCYTHMLHRDAAWVDSLVIDFQQQGVGKVLPSIQVSESYLDKPFTRDEFCACIRYTLKHQRNGIVFWSWEMLEQDSLKQKCVKEMEFNGYPGDSLKQQEE
jgi:hypothetical protein